MGKLINQYWFEEGSVNKIGASLKDYIGAIEDFNKAIELDKESKVYSSRGRMKKNLLDYIGAMLDYNIAVEKYPEDEIKFDITKIKLTTLDIEVASENGFPDTESASEEILTITIQDYATKKIITWGIKPFNNTQDNVEYIYCKDETDLLDRFLFYNLFLFFLAVSHPTGNFALKGQSGYVRVLN